MKDIKIENKIIGEGKPCFIVAEIGQNHNGKVKIAKKLIDAAAEAGVDAVKFCKRNLDVELTEEAYNRPYEGYHSFGKTYGEHRKYLELTEEQYKELYDYTVSRELIFFASVCAFKSVDFLDELGAPVFKIASRDLTNLPLVKYIAKKGKPVIASTGMSTLSEIEDAVEIIKKCNDELILLKCTSSYPTPYEEVNLMGIKTLRKRFNVLTGFSGHTIGIVMPVIARALGAVVVEKHLTLARYMKGSDHASSLEPNGMKRVVRDIRNLEKALGDGKIRIMPSEEKNRKKLARSIVLKKEMKKGEVIKKSILTMKSPGTGLKAKNMEYFIGKKVKNDLEKDHILRKEDVE